MFCIFQRNVLYNRLVFNTLKDGDKILPWRAEGDHYSQEIIMDSAQYRWIQLKAIWVWIQCNSDECSFRLVVLTDLLQWIDRVQVYVWYGHRCIRESTWYLWFSQWRLVRVLGIYYRDTVSKLERYQDALESFHLWYWALESSSLNPLFAVHLYIAQVIHLRQ